MTKQFKVGDRVEYTGTISPSLMGRTGTVEKADEDNNIVVFFPGAGGSSGGYGFERYGVLPESLTLIPAEAPSSLPKATLKETTVVTRTVVLELPEEHAKVLKDYLFVARRNTLAEVYETLTAALKN